jgi:hypothetical protein
MLFGDSCKIEIKMKSADRGASRCFHQAGGITTRDRGRTGHERTAEIAVQAGGTGKVRAAGFLLTWTVCASPSQRKGLTEFMGEFDVQANGQDRASDGRLFFAAKALTTLRICALTCFPGPRVIISQPRRSQVRLRGPAADGF